MLSLESRYKKTAIQEKAQLAKKHAPNLYTSANAAKKNSIRVLKYVTNKLKSCGIDKCLAKP